MGILPLRTPQTCLRDSNLNLPLPLSKQPAKAVVLPGSHLTSVIKHAVDAGSDRQLCVSPATHPEPIYHDSNIRPNDGCTPREGSYSTEEIAKQHHNTVQLDAESDQRPPQQYQSQPSEERRRAFCLLLPRKEEKCLLRPDYYGKSDQEEDLSPTKVSLGTGLGGHRIFVSRGPHTFPIASLARCPNVSQTKIPQKGCR